MDCHLYCTSWCPVVLHLKVPSRLIEKCGSIPGHLLYCQLYCTFRCKRAWLGIAVKFRDACWTVGSTAPVGAKFCLFENYNKIQGRLLDFKGTVSRDFLLLVFFLNQFPPSIWLYHFFRKFAEIFAAQGLPRCQQHRWQMEKTFKKKNFNNFVWTPLGSRVNIYINFCLRFTLRCLKPDIVAIICHRCQRHRRQICRRCRWYRWHFATSVVDTGCKFAAGIVDTGGKFTTGINNASENGVKICRRCRWYRWQICHRCHWYRWCTLTREYLCDFSKKFETVYMEYSGVGGKLIHGKNQKQKNSWHCPFKVYFWTLRCTFGL